MAAPSRGDALDALGAQRPPPGSVLDAPVELQERLGALRQEHALPPEQRGLDGQVVDPPLEPHGRALEPELLEHEEDERQLDNLLEEVAALPGLVEADAEEEAADEVRLRWQVAVGKGVLGGVSGAPAAEARSRGRGEVR